MEVTILNGKKWDAMKWNDRRRARHNPDESFVSRTGPMVLAAVVAAPLAVAADRALAGLKKADGNRRFTDNQVAGMVAGLGVAGAVVAQVNEMAPRVGAAVGAAFGALAVRRAYDARSVGQAQQGARQGASLPAPAPAPALPQGAPAPSPAQVSAAQTAAPSTPATPQGAPPPTPATSTEVARSGAIIRRAGAAYDATYGQVSRSGAPVSPTSPDSLRAAPRIVPVMASQEEINHVTPQAALRPAFVVGGRPSDQVKTFAPMQGAIRPSGAPMVAVPSPVGSVVPSNDETDAIDATINCRIVARHSGESHPEVVEGSADEALAQSVIDETLASVSPKRSGALAAECGCGPTGARVMQRRAF